MPKQTHRTRKVRHLVKLIVASVPELTVIENEWRELLAVGERERERERRRGRQTPAETCRDTCA